MTTADEFISQIDAYLIAHSVSASAFGRSAIGDPNLVSDLKAGRMPNLRTVERVMEFMAGASEPERAS